LRELLAGMISDYDDFVIYDWLRLFYQQHQRIHHSGVKNPTTLPKASDRCCGKEMPPKSEPFSRSQKVFGAMYPSAPTGTQKG
jgi:hypothetical protein